MKITMTAFRSGLVLFISLMTTQMAMAGEFTALIGKGTYSQKSLTLAYQSAPFMTRALKYSSLDLSLEYSLGVIRASDNRNRQTWHVGVTPILRWWFEPGTALEAGVGANLFSRTYIGNENISTAFQFGDSIGLLHRINGSAWILGLRYTHYSNAGIRNPNPGLGYVQLRVSRAFY